MTKDVTKSEQLQFEIPNIRLLADRLLIHVAKDKDQTTASGIIISAASQEEKSKLGTVLRLSKRVSRELEDDEKIEINDTVMFSAYAGSDVSYKGVDFKILRVTDVFGVIDPEDSNE